MDGFEFNKIAGAVLATGLAVLGLGIIAEFIYEPIEAEEPAYVIAVATPAADAHEDAEPVAEESIAMLLQGADVAKGQSEAKKCQACHTFDQGGPAKVGPNLWNVVGRPVASVEGFGYSEAFRGLGGEGGTWTFEQLNTFLEAPKSAVAGTSMAFVGLKKAAPRANVIAFLRSLSDAPLALPGADEAETEAADASHGDGEEPASE